MPLSPESLAAYLTPFVPRDYRFLFESEVLEPADLVTIGSALAWMQAGQHDELVGWYRALGDVLFERFSLGALPQRRALRELTSGSELLRALGIVGSPDWDDALGRSWWMRGLLLGLPEVGSGALAGNPYQLTLDRSRMPVELHPLASVVADELSAHVRSANALARKLDRAIVALWGCPVERLDQRVTVAELVVGGLELQIFEP
ncbi:hypothetical protein K8640_21265 [Myxococcus sp. XM-1-1-1]|uniref:hypothetical protein n=1 Tax=Myxococcus sp. XM-1-1-1 TaxID=2874602 RepID=UPI001CBD577B|nr:hypothetical protein [Myxococcus sp. XM-1-1-1]MBZ4410748.1 hypothetical protein [Myxococcus sp. XM-1-1-1]